VQGLDATYLVLKYQHFLGEEEVSGAQEFRAFYFKGAAMLGREKIAVSGRFWVAEENGLRAGFVPGGCGFGAGCHSTGRSSRCFGLGYALALGFGHGWKWLGECGYGGVEECGDLCKGLGGLCYVQL